MKIIRSFVFLAASLFAGHLVVEGAPTRMTFNVGGVERRALVFPPSSSEAGGKFPLILAFHGHGGNMNGAARAMPLQNAWPEAIVVYPQGLRTVSEIDPQGLRPGWQISPGQDDDRDLKFVDTILARMREKFHVDDGRIFATGFSNGAIFTYLLWSQRPNDFAAFGVCAGRIRESFKITVPKPLIHIGGNRDKLIPIDYQKESVATARRVNGCSEQGQACGRGCTFYPSSKGAPVEMIVHPFGHVYPPFAATRIVNFFKQAGPKVHSR
jgi:polyhydroxybutyrate depolymerase